MLMPRKVDDRMFALQRQGGPPSCSAPLATRRSRWLRCSPSTRTRDWVLPYYRDMGVGLAWGFTPLEVFLAVFAKKDDQMSGGRQLPSHWSDPNRRVFTQSSVIGTQFPHAAASPMD
jgi:2-oxoisovalerate dehydrogenase E1 component alpha subunit